MILNKVPYEDDGCIDIGTFSTTADLYSALDTFGASLNDSDSKDIHFVCTASPFYDSTAPASDIFAVFYRSSTGRYFCECFNSLSSNIQPILLWRWSGGWARKTLTYGNNVTANITSTNATVVVQNCQRSGDVVVFNCIVTLDSAVSKYTEIIKLPWKVKGRYDFNVIASFGNTAYALSIADNTDSLVANTGSANLPAGTYIIAGSYVAN